jgi:hypothetical protein
MGADFCRLPDFRPFVVRAGDVDGDVDASEEVSIFSAIVACWSPKEMIAA